ncbi:MAG: hypothetical protein WC699_03365 [Bacteroidales bacterium]|jgi:hypothetical protein
MLKRPVGVLLVLIANMLLVAHSIIPHQHYGGFAWIPADHYEDHHNPAGIHTEDADHKHQDHDHDQSCLLAQAYLVPGNPSRFDCPLADHQNQNLDFQPIFIDQNNFGDQPFFYKIPLPPLILPGRLPLAVTSCSGLRAPPAR